MVEFDRTVSSLEEREIPELINHVLREDITPFSEYIIISAVRDEEKYIQKTIKSVVSQTIKPAAWVIVDDGSKDKTRDIIERHSQQYSWIKVLSLPDTGERRAGSGVIAAFNKGYVILEDLPSDFIVKLDGDLSFDDQYFEKIFSKFRGNPRLGIAAGWVYDLINRRLRPHIYPKNHVRGCIKTYRRECFRDIGGLIPTLGWDGIDEMKARMNGWETESFKDLEVLHYRAMGSVGGILRGRLRDARGACVMGYHPLFMLGRCVFKMFFDKPYAIGGFAMLAGFFFYKFKGVRPINDQPLIKFIRREQMRRLRSLGKNVDE
jgi:biofilm PGA synthesis N-glycosyltransferase PgaC